MPQPETLLEGKYEILKKLREGGMGTIYRVRHRLLDEVRAIKVMRAHVVADADLKRRFIDEAKTATRLKHPNICTVHDFAVGEDGTAYLVMEFIEGVNLADLLRAQGPPHPALTLEIAHQALLALAYLHRKGVVHRDISPDNLMLTSDPDDRTLVKLIDLGIAKTTTDRPASELTASGTFLGKLKYASPEQFGTLKSGERLDGRSDLYGLGVVLYELLTGRRPCPGETPAELMRSHVFNPPLPFSETDPENKVPAELRTVVLKALEKERDHRYETAEDFDQAILGLRGRFREARDPEDTRSHPRERLSTTVKRAGSATTRPAESRSASLAARVAIASRSGSASENLRPSSARSSTSGRHNRSLASAVPAFHISGVRSLRSRRLASSNRWTPSVRSDSVAASVALARYPAHVHQRTSSPSRVITSRRVHGGQMGVTTSARIRLARSVSATGGSSPSSTSRTERDSAKLAPDAPGVTIGPAAAIGRSRRSNAAVSSRSRSPASCARQQQQPRPLDLLGQQRGSVRPISRRPSITVNCGGAVNTAVIPMKCRCPNRCSAAGPTKSSSPSCSTKPSATRCRKIGSALRSNGARPFHSSAHEPAADPALLQAQGEELLGHDVPRLRRRDDRLDVARAPQLQQPGGPQQGTVVEGEEQAVAAPCPAGGRCGPAAAGTTRRCRARRSG